MRIKLVALMSAFGLFLSILSMPVKADPFDGGLAIGIAGNFSSWDTSGTETEGSDSNTNTETETSAKVTKAADVDFASLVVEYNMRGNWLGLGLGLEYVPGAAELGAQSRTDTDTDSGGSRSVTYTAKAEVENLITATLEPTIYLNDNIGFYVKGSFSAVTVNSLETLEGGISSSSYPNEAIYGTSYGAGIRAIHSSGFYLKAEYVETEFESLVFQSTSGNSNKVTADVENEVARIVLGYQF